MVGLLPFIVHARSPLYNLLSSVDDAHARVRARGGRGQLNLGTANFAKPCSSVTRARSLAAVSRLSL
jgi:hypothetical protein